MADTDFDEESPLDYAAPGLGVTVSVRDPTTGNFIAIAPISPGALKGLYMADTDFEVGDEVYWELAPTGRQRWEDLVDGGATGCFVGGKVNWVTGNHVFVECTNATTGFDSVWSIAGVGFDPSQWALPGFLSRTLKSGQTETISYWGYPAPPVPVCDCGGAKAKTTHASWCSLSKK